MYIVIISLYTLFFLERTNTMLFITSLFRKKYQKPYKQINYIHMFIYILIPSALIFNSCFPTEPAEASASTEEAKVEDKVEEVKANGE